MNEAIPVSKNTGVEPGHRKRTGESRETGMTYPFLLLTLRSVTKNRMSGITILNTRLCTALHVSGPKAPTQFKIKVVEIQVFESRKNLRNPLPTSIVQFAGYIVGGTVK